MLQDIRKGAQGTAAKIIIGLIVISFSIFGIESILVGGSSDAVAEVNGEEVSGRELSRIVVRETRQLIQMLGDRYSPDLIDESQLRAQALDSLVARKALVQSADNMSLAVSEEEIGRVVASMPPFQIDGVFNPELYKQILSQEGYTPSSFKEGLRQDLKIMQLRSGLAATEFQTPAELDLNVATLAAQRDFRYLLIPRNEVSQEQSITEADIESYYTRNEQAFLSEESIDVEYIQLGLADFIEPVDEQQLREAYEESIASFAGGTESRVAHILLTEQDGASIEDRLAEIQQQLAEGASFAALAEEYSDDIGTARRGGDLGYTNGSAFPDAIEDAVVALEPGTVSDPVETDAGTHLLLVNERREVSPPTFTELRDDLESSLQRDEARRELLLTVDELRDISFNAEDLEEPASELELDISRADGVTRTAGEGAFDSRPVREKAFSEEVLVAGHNSEVIEFAENEFIVFRVAEHKLPELQPLEEVREQIVDTLIDEATEAALAAQATAIIRRLENGEAVDDIAAELGLEWQVELAASRQSFSAPPTLVSRAFTLPVNELPVRDYVLTQSGDAAVIELIGAHAGELDALTDDESTQLERSLAAESGNLINFEFQQRQRASADVVVM